MKRNLIFTGIKHSGKTLFASLIAKELSLCFFDTDKIILDSIDEESIREYYINHGKNNFMLREKEAYEKALRDSLSSKCVIALGGGAADNIPLMEGIKNNDDLLIYLKREEELILPHILKDGIPPFLDKDDTARSFHTLYTHRDKLYSEYASLIINLGPYGEKKEKADLILNILKENINEW